MKREPGPGAAFPDMRAAVRMHWPSGPRWARSTQERDRYARAVAALWRVRVALRGDDPRTVSEALVELELRLADLEDAAATHALARGDTQAAATHAARRRHFEAWADARRQWLDGPVRRRGRQAVEAAAAGGRQPKPTSRRDDVLALAKKFAGRDPHQVAGLIAQRLGITPHAVRRILREERKADRK